VVFDLIEIKGKTAIDDDNEDLAEMLEIYTARTSSSSLRLGPAYENSAIDSG
jgi:hypothetical protein